MSLCSTPLLAAVALPFLAEIVALLVISIGIAYVCYRTGLASIAGFLVAGVVIGPSALGLVQDQALIDSMAEVGVILLLFTIGIEFKLEKLARIGRAVFLGGGLQVGLTVGLVVALLAAFGVSWQAGVYTGCLVALSSTVIVLGLLAERGETDTPAGGLSLAVLIFQDLAIIAMVLLVPMLAGQGGTGLEVIWALAKAGGLVAAVLVLARKAVPWLLEKIVRTRRTELFLLTVVTICFGTAWLTSLAGVSLALGAFLAGLVVSESAYSEHALSEVLPLRTVFNAIFFVSVGMLLDVTFLAQQLPLVLGVAAAVLLLKVLLTTSSVLVLGYPVQVAAAAGLTLAQIGEFSFVLERAGRSAGLSPAGLGVTGEQTFIAVTVLLMIVTPFLVQGAPKLGQWLERTPLRRLGRLGQRQEEATVEETAKLEDHVIVVGFGPGGRRLVRVLKDTGIPFVIIELNPQNVDEAREAGLPVIYGDASRQHLLELARVKHAKVCVVAINDPQATLRVVRLVHYENPTLQVIVRTRYLHEVERLHEAGADIVVPEELETAVRLFSQVLNAYMVPPEEIEAQMRTLRADDYGIFRGSIQEAHLMVLRGLDEEGLHTRAVAVHADAPAAGRTLEDLRLRRDYGLTVLSVRRDGQAMANPDGSFRIQPNDRLVLVGSADRFVACAPLFREQTAGEGIGVGGKG
ncbi:MAG: sodium:proton exchanger [Bacteroidetes bacterium]|jgi:CPA2 family monovalent cation:H+ antiporter-2|nr:sodium:proton exchanger [Bacteroidota bacterium]